MLKGIVGIEKAPADLLEIMCFAGCGTGKMSMEWGKTSRPSIMTRFMSFSVSQTINNMIKRAQRISISVMFSRAADWKSTQCGIGFGKLNLENV